LFNVARTLADRPPPPPEFPDMTILFRRSIEMYGAENFEELKRKAAAEEAAEDGVSNITPCCVSLVSSNRIHQFVTCLTATGTHVPYIGVNLDKYPS